MKKKIKLGGWALVQVEQYRNGLGYLHNELYFRVEKIDRIMKKKFISTHEMRWLKKLMKGARI